MTQTTHHYQDLINIFNQCFINNYQTQLVKGDDEPIYIPANQTQPLHTIYFAYGYFSSALHECAHWLIAGEKRRQLIDFGYWYEPDGRDAIQQKQFQQVEIKPQALEWILSKACGYRFQLSIDNLDGEPIGVDDFKQAIFQQIMDYCEQGLSVRAEIFRKALCQYYQQPLLLSKEQFTA